MKMPLASARPRRQLLPLLALTLGAFACSHNPDNPMPDAATPPDASVPLTAIQRGEAVAKKYNCGTCHNPENAADGILSGQMTPRPGTMVYGANLTPDKDTGILDWTDDEIITAVRTGIDDGGEELCLVMPRFKAMADADAHDLVAYLRSLKAVNRAIPDSMCPPIKPKPMDGGTHD